MISTVSHETISNTMNMNEKVLESNYKPSSPFCCFDWNGSCLIRRSARFSGRFAVVAVILFSYIHHIAFDLFSCLSAPLSYRFLVQYSLFYKAAF